MWVFQSSFLHPVARLFTCQRLSFMDVLAFFHPCNFFSIAGFGSLKRQGPVFLWISGCRHRYLDLQATILFRSLAQLFDHDEDAFFDIPLSVSSSAQLIAGARDQGPICAYFRSFRSNTSALLCRCPALLWAPVSFGRTQTRWALLRQASTGQRWHGVVAPSRRWYAAGRRHQCGTVPLSSVETTKVPSWVTKKRGC